MNRPTLADAMAMIAEWLAEHPNNQLVCDVAISPDQTPRWFVKIYPTNNGSEVHFVGGDTIQEAVIKLAQIIVEKP